MGLDEDFNKAVDDVKKLKSTPDNQALLDLYGLYKQSTVGDCNTDRPGMVDFKGKAKWDAWNKLKGTASEQSKQDYIKKVSELIVSLGIN